MTAKCREALIGLSSPFKANDAYIFITDSGRPVAYSNLSRAFTLAVKKSKVEVDGARYSMHSFRHAYATALILDGVDAQVVSRLLGHSSTALLFSRYSTPSRRCVGHHLHAVVERALAGGAS